MLSSSPNDTQPLAALYIRNLEVVLEGSNPSPRIQHVGGPIEVLMRGQFEADLDFNHSPLTVASPTKVGGRPLQHYEATPHHIQTMKNLERDRELLLDRQGRHDSFRNASQQSPD